MDVAILVSSLGGGGAERIAINVAESLASRMECRIIPIYVNQDYYVSHLTDVPIISYSQNIFIRMVKRPIILYRYIRYLKKNNVNVSLSILTEDNLINLFASIFTHSSPIISVHGMPVEGFCLSYIFEWIVFNFVKYSKTKIISVSNGVAESLINQYSISSSQIEVIYNPIDIAKIVSMSKEPIMDPRVNMDKPTLITVGRLTEIKAQWHLIRVFAELRKTYDCQLLICGIGEEMDFLLNLAYELGIENDVVFLGWQENPYKYMRISRLLVHTSLSESFGNVIVEAMACGCPSVVANCSPALKEILGSDDSCGILTKNMTGIRHSALDSLDDCEFDLLAGIQKIMDDDVLQNHMSSECIHRAKLFDLKYSIEKYIDLIRDINL